MIPSTSLGAGFVGPDLMAIGDSIFNGTRSLSTTPGLAKIAVPALVARGLGFYDSFRRPDYPRPVLFDIEEHLRRGLDFGRLREECLENAQAWLAGKGVWSNRRYFDNISIAGATYANLFCDTSARYKEEAARAFKKLQSSPGLNFDAIFQLYYAINAAFLLNPSGLPELDYLTPLDQVAVRRPKRLLVDIGNNDGLFRVAITAAPTPTLIRRLKAIPDLADRLATFLKEKCSEMEHIYFNLLIRPRVLANLAPRTDEDMYVTPPNGGYFKSYVGRLGSLNEITGEQMKAFDDLIAEVNSTTRDVLTKKLGDRLHLIDLFDWSTNYDRKHGSDENTVVVEHHGRPRRLSNYPFSALGGFRQGGLFGLDNMHPTIVGYALLANYIGAAVQSAEPGLKYEPLSLQATYEADSLLQSPPGSWDFLVFMASLAGAFVNTGDSAEVLLS